MACNAAKKYALAVVQKQPLTAEEVWNRVRWWTPATIKEALEELAEFHWVGTTGAGEYRVYSSIGR